MMEYLQLPGVAPVCWLCQMFAVFCMFNNWGVPACKFSPIATRYLGPLTFMTTQCNLFLLGYFTLSVAAFVLGVGGSVLELHLIKWSPVMFAFGAFLTTMYYSLDHWNPERVKARRAWKVTGYPLVEYAVNGTHGLGLPLAGAFILALRNSDMDVAARITTDDVLYRAGGYIMFYTTQAHLNWLATGVWPYPILDDVTKAFGPAGRTMFFVVLSGIFIGFGLCGRWLLSI